MIPSRILLVAAAVAVASVAPGCKERKPANEGSRGAAPGVEGPALNRGTTDPETPTSPGDGAAPGTAPDAGSVGAAPSLPAVPAVPERIELPSYWFGTDFDQLVGTRVADFDLVKFMPKKPEGLDQGEHFLVFYSRTCEHCEEMFRKDLAPNAALARKVIAVEIPESETVMTSPDAWSMPRTEVGQLLQLPMGVNWIITSPITMRVKDGVIECAEEGGHRPCMGLE